MNTPHIGPGITINCSITGPDHHRDGENNQDSCHNKSTSDNQEIIAVADGLGQAELADIGSEIAATNAVRYLHQEIESDDDNEVTKQSIKGAVTAARDAIKEKASGHDLDIRQFETTLLVAVASPEKVVGGAVGDGGIVCQVGDEYQLLVDREESDLDLEASHITVPLIQSEGEETLRLGTLEQCEGVAVFSDGLEEFSWDGAHANKSFFDSIFSLLRDHQQPEPAETKLETALQSNPYQNFGDDKTIVVADLPVPVDEFTLKTEQGKKLTPHTSVEDDLEGALLTLENAENSAVRLFRPVENEESDLSQKLRAMVDNPPEPQRPGATSSISEWPERVVTSTSGPECVGYAFARPDESDSGDESLHEFTPANFATDFQLTQSNSSSDTRPSVDEAVSADPRRVSLNMARFVKQIHDQDHAFGNLYSRCFHLRSEAIRSTEYASMFISGQTETFQSDHTHTQYHDQQRLSTGDQYRHQDRFDLAVIVFKLLMSGVHPFETDESGSTEQHRELIQSNEFPYGDTTEGELSPPEAAPEYDRRVISNLQDLFEQCFTEGKTNPAERPKPGKWVFDLQSI